MSTTAFALVGVSPASAQADPAPTTARGIAFPSVKPAAPGDPIVTVELTDGGGERSAIAEDGDANGDTVLTPAMGTSEFFVAGVTWAAGDLLPAGSRILLRTLEGDEWSNWLEVGIEDAPTGPAEDELVNGSEPFVTSGATAVQMRVTGGRGELPASLALTLVPTNPDIDNAVTFSDLPADPSAGTDPIPDILEESPEVVELGTGEPTAAATASGALAMIGSGRSAGTSTPLGLRRAPAGSEDVAISSPTASTATTPAGTIITRAGWGADEAYTDANWAPKYYPLDAAVVHHTAGTNTYTATQSAGIVNGIFVYHAVTRGWGDIGYNFLVDKYGQIFEGRKYSLQSQSGVTAGWLVEAGHALSYNRGSLGISAMGNFDVTGSPATGPVVTAMSRVIAWKFDEANIDMATKSAFLSPATRYTTTYPTGTALPRIFGHGDVASTACPGSTLKTQLPALRTAVAALYTLDTNRAPVANAGPDQAVTAGGTVALNGTGSTDPDGNPLTYAWTQTSGTTVTLSGPTTANPTFTAPAGPATLVFSLVVRDGTVNSTADTVTITVAASSDTNLAPTATVVATSQNTATSQTAAKAVDGSILGYPVDHTKEWATTGEKAGAALTLTWATPVTLNRVVLFDRPNTLDQITSATLTFSDNTTQAVPALANDGTATTITFPAKATTTLRLTINTTSTTTANTGLAEIQAWGTAAPTAMANLAGTAAVVASSQNTGTGQLASKATDGVALGYPVDHTKEWATIGGTGGSWIQLNWDTPVTLDRVVLFDRPNTLDQITSATLTFSDNTTQAVPALANDGTATTITFPAKATTTLRLTINTTSTTTANTGLAEIQAWGYTAG